MARLTADIWVSAYLTRLRLNDIPVFVVKKGDATAGAVLVKVNTLDGKACVYARQFDMMADKREWVELASGPERDVDDALAKQRGYDPDLWIIEVEDRAGRSLLNEIGLSD
ncbi:hypothetical protein EDD53_2828 [Pacificibacter maritimus]|uniref:DUF1491 family protein n=1 Tax=Pacificibacter maritimus TaxID=762213 RepID=A0A3N4U802_9RHOB|nr:DUF1491 family protein [Pacificibacter maritimus]RPE63231.1 hypothetical protein EDD53_2828 [Pacificibacter maritimus]